MPMMAIGAPVDSDGRPERDLKTFFIIGPTGWHSSVKQANIAYQKNKGQSKSRSPELPIAKQTERKSPWDKTIVLTKTGFARRMRLFTGRTEDMPRLGILPFKLERIAVENTISTLRGRLTPGGGRVVRNGRDLLP